MVCSMITLQDLSTLKDAWNSYILRGSKKRPMNWVQWKLEHSINQPKTQRKNWYDVENHLQNLFKKCIHLVYNLHDRRTYKIYLST